MILIGSRAVALRCSNFRKQVDFDFVCTQREYEEWMEKNSAKVNSTKIYSLPEFNKQIVEGSTNIEFEIITTGTSSELLADLVYNDKDTIDTPFAAIPSLSVLLAIKDSHKYKKFETPAGCANFYKHALDWHFMVRSGVELKPEHEEFRKLREKETYTHKLPKLNVSSKDFFDSDMNGIVQFYIHDDIHKAIAIDGIPAFEKYLKDGSEVLTDKKKFFECSEDVRMAGIIEEGMVLALERSLLIHGTWPADYAFKFAMGKVSSTICGGYFREYAYLHLFEALKKYPKDYWEKFQKAVVDGKVRRYNNNDEKNIRI